MRMSLSKVAFGFVCDDFQNQATRRQVVRTFSASTPFGLSVLKLVLKFYDCLSFTTTFKYTPTNDHCEKGAIGLDDGFNTLSDGMDGKLKKAATYFEFNPDEILDDDYAFRPDVSFRPVSTYEIEDLDLTVPGTRKFGRRSGFEVTTEEVLEKADFRNVRFLSNFLTEAGLIFKRKQTKISVKAQRKIAREIKTARAFGLMPFTTMGTKSFVYGKTMEAKDEDFEYESYSGHPGADADMDLDATAP